MTPTPEAMEKAREVADVYYLHQEQVDDPAIEKLTELIAEALDSHAALAVAGALEAATQHLLDMAERRRGTTSVYPDILYANAAQEVRGSTPASALAALAAHDAEVRISEHRRTCGRCAMQENYPIHESLKCERYTELQRTAQGKG